MTRLQLPEIIRQVGFDFAWENEKVWALDYPAEPMPVTDLTWHFDVPFLGNYDLKPWDVLDYPERHPEEYARTMEADTDYPADIMHWRGRWLLLDGLHRAMKTVIMNKDTIQVRKIPKSEIPNIRK